ncbi:MAG: glycosyltransferase [Acidobacteria bacterium]|nr:glycosyltransferase [Acidobacteriota bacterium]
MLSLSGVFPRAGDERLGLFVKSRLAALSRRVPVRVVCPVPWIDLSRGRIELPALDAKSPGDQSGLEVDYPVWFYPPGWGTWNGLFMARALQGRLARCRRSFDFQLIDAHFGHPEGIAADRLARHFRVPFTVTLRGNETMHASHPKIRLLMAESLQRAAAVICVSSPLRDFALSLGVDAERAHVVPNGIDAAVFRPHPREETRQQLRMDPDSLHVLSAGYLIARKGHHRVVNALAEVRRQGVPAQLWIVGGPGREGDCQEEIRNAVERLGLAPFVHLTGSVGPAELARYMAASDVFCLASEREGWPNVVNEALACGTPAVAFDVGGVPQMLPGDQYGIVVPPANDAALTAALCTALRRGWDRAAIARWGAGRSWEAVAAQVADLFRTIVGESIAPPDRLS